MRREKRHRLYVSKRADGSGDVFRAADPPTCRADLPEGGIYAVGPFRTRAAAELCANREHAPWLQSVAQFEKAIRSSAPDAVADEGV